MLYPMTGLSTARVTSMLDKASSITHTAHMLRGAHMHAHTCTNHTWVYVSRGEHLCEGQISISSASSVALLLSLNLELLDLVRWVSQRAPRKSPVAPHSQPPPPALGSQTQTKTPGFFLWVLRMQTHIFIFVHQALAQISHFPSSHNKDTLGRLKVTQNFRKYRKLENPYSFWCCPCFLSSLVSAENHKSDATHHYITQDATFRKMERKFP